jgi:hypothetical protein
MKYRVSSSGCRVSSFGFEFRISRFGFRVSSFKFSIVKCRVGYSLFWTCSLGGIRVLVADRRIGKSDRRIGSADRRIGGSDRRIGGSAGLADDRSVTVSQGFDHASNQQRMSSAATSHVVLLLAMTHNARDAVPGLRLWFPSYPLQPKIDIKFPSQSSGTQTQPPSQVVNGSSTHRPPEKSKVKDTKHDRKSQKHLSVPRLRHDTKLC